VLGLRQCPFRSEQVPLNVLDSRDSVRHAAKRATGTRAATAPSSRNAPRPVG
jgi:hypothetical protein